MGFLVISSIQHSVEWNKIQRGLTPVTHQIQFQVLLTHKKGERNPRQTEYECFIKNRKR
jgi:hypothetical protein